MVAILSKFTVLCLSSYSIVYVQIKINLALSRMSPMARETRV